MSRKGLRVGIVGAGVAGCSAAYFLRQEFPSFTEITVYEREPFVGGRILTKMFAGAEVELGASFIHSTNRLVNSLIDSLGLKRCPSIHEGTNSQFTVGVWNGTRFVLRLPASRPLKYARLALRYGISLVRLRRSVQKVLAQWEQIYGLQSASSIFASPKEIFESLGLLEATSKETDGFLARDHVSSLVRVELCCAILRAIFNQTLDVNTFAGVTGLVASGIGGGTTFSVSGGNQRICLELLAATDAQVHTGRGVAVVDSTQDHGITVIDDKGIASTFDAVLLSMPLDVSRITLRRDGTALNMAADTEWRSVTITCVAGNLSPAFFGLTPQSTVPNLVLTTEEAGMPFSAITPVATRDSARHIYKIASDRSLDERLLNDLFLNIDEVFTMTWRAYPCMNPKASTIPFTLTGGLYYVNAMENIVSTLETEVLASRNAVRLMRRDFPCAM